MLKISEVEIVSRIQTENSWWNDQTISAERRSLQPRPYLELFLPLVESRQPHRAVVLMGPRRVGKTVMIHHAIQALIDSGIEPRKICYLSIDNPVYNGLSLETLLNYCQHASRTDYKKDEAFIFFDEVQYLRKWEVHLKTVVDNYRNLKCVASGSAAAALRLKSNESGAGRFTDFLLPPLTFYEYMQLSGKTHLFGTQSDHSHGLFFDAIDIEGVNEEFLKYLNFGGYPEVVFSPQVQADPARFIKSDIIDKVLLRDLPSLYGIDDIQELNYLFTTLAFNTANEISLGELSQNAGVAKNTIKRYIEYLEAAFLIKIVHRVSQTSKRFARANFFKVYLTNPSMRAALFAPLKADDAVVASLAETAIYSQWFHSDTPLYYARWNDGEVDIVSINNRQKAQWAVEVKWSDRFCDKPADLKSLLNFCSHNKLKKVIVTSKTKTVLCKVGDLSIPFIPASVYCYTVGYNIIEGKTMTNLEVLGEAQTEVAHLPVSEAQVAS
jgi:predicted AAA+ superfamily ATPase